MSEIIIDSANVSGCAFYKLGVCISPINKSCKDCNDIDINKCYFKQLKRLQAENEELKAKYEEVANENLKEIYELIKKNDVWRGIVNVMNERLEKQVKTYKQALEEIRGILDKSCNQCKNEYLSEDYCSGQGDCFEIRQVINEVLK